MIVIIKPLYNANARLFVTYSFFSDFSNNKLFSVLYEYVFAQVRQLYREFELFRKKKNSRITGQCLELTLISRISKCYQAKVNAFNFRTLHICQKVQQNFEETTNYLQFNYFRRFNFNLFRLRPQCCSLFTLVKRERRSIQSCLCNIGIISIESCTKIIFQI